MKKNQLVSYEVIECKSDIAVVPGSLSDIPSFLNSLHKYMIEAAINIQKSQIRDQDKDEILVSYKETA